MIKGEIRLGNEDATALFWAGEVLRKTIALANELATAGIAAAVNVELDLPARVDVSVDIGVGEKGEGRKA